jgi:hypothetical protein
VIVLTHELYQKFAAKRDEVAKELGKNVAVKETEE